MIEYAVTDIAQLINGKVEGDENVKISAPAKIEEGTPGTITFLADEKYEKHIYTTGASAAIVKSDFIPLNPLSLTLIRVDNVYEALGVLLDRFQDKKVNLTISESASVHENVSMKGDCFIGDHACISKDVSLGTQCEIHPGVFIGENVTLGDHVILMPGVKVYHGSVIGNNVIIHANTVIGSDGFGFSKDAQGNYKKIPQLGNVIIEDDVEIGSNVCIDRATMGSTLIRRGVKLDNLIQIGHNVEIGEHTVIAAQTGIAGSTRVGKNCMIGGQVGIVGHITIADGTMIQAQSGINRSIKNEGSKLYGTPALDYTDFLKSYAHFKNLPNIIQEIREIRKQITNLEP